VSSLLKTATLTFLVAVGSYLAARLGASFVISREAVSALWPGCALLVSVLLVVPRKTWPVLIPAGLVGFVIQDLQFGLPPRAIAIFLVTDALEILIGALGLSYLFNGVPQLNNLRALMKYCVMAVFLAPFACSFIGANAFPGFYWTNWRISFFSEALAFLTLTPAILSWAGDHTSRKRRSFRMQLEAASLISALLLLSYFVFLVHRNSMSPGLLYSLVPLLLWAALRFGSLGVSTSVIIIAFSSIWGSTHERGPFTGPDAMHNILSLQLFLVFAAIPFMILAALAEERERDQSMLSNLSRRLIDAQEQERVWIARELHDDICQRLAMLSTQIVKTARGRLSALPLGDQLEQISQQCSDLTGDVQALSHKLHPSMLENLGLVMAIKSFSREFSEQNNAVVDFTDRNIPKALPREVSLSLFRVVQEALHNALKHSREKHFKVLVKAVAGEIELEVIDQGVGFDVTSAASRNGLGLVSMAERISLVNGNFNVYSQPNAGTRIHVRVPLLNSSVVDS
jgi:signal transduction histidine kinase